MFWPGVLAVASDLQLIPRLMGLDALKAAVEQVSVAPHRVKVDSEVVSVLPDGSGTLQLSKPSKASKLSGRSSPTRWVTSLFRGWLTDPSVLVRVAKVKRGSV